LATLPSEFGFRSIGTLSNSVEVDEFGIGVLDVVGIGMETVGDSRGCGDPNVPLGVGPPPSSRVEVSVRYRAGLLTLKIRLTRFEI
jgi:hypothetical protein